MHVLDVTSTESYESSVTSWPFRLEKPTPMLQNQMKNQSVRIILNKSKVSKSETSINSKDNISSQNYISS